MLHYHFCKKCSHSWPMAVILLLPSYTLVNLEVLDKWTSAASLGFGSAAPGKCMVFLVPQIEFQAMIKIKKS